MNLSLLKRLFTKKNTIKSGFSFNDLTLIMSTVAIVTISAIAINTVENAKRNQLADSKKIQAIYKAIGNYALKYKRLPCPAGINKKIGIDTDYGAEVGVGSTCVSGNGVYELSADANLLYGAIPTKSIGLISDYSFDQYGSKFVYVVDKRASFDVGSVNAVNFGNVLDNVIKIKENENLINNVLFLIVSYGKNKLGAYASNSNSYNTLPTSSNAEIDNSFTSITGNVLSVNDTTFVKSIKGDTNFDDVIFSKSKLEFINDFGANFLIPCKDAGDLFNNKSAYFGEVVYAKSNCPSPNDQIRSAKRCSNEGKWIYDKSCPCYVEIDGVESANVPNGIGNLKCTKSQYSGVLKYNCKDNGSLEINEYCKKSCTFNTIGIATIIPSGTSKVSCNLPNYKGNYVISCDDGVVTSQIGSCSNETCTVGGYAGMIQQTVYSGASNVNGLCDTDSGYSGSYSYSCIDGVPMVTNNCFKNCSFNTVGFTFTDLKHGKYFYSCPTDYVGKGITVVCNNGVGFVESGSCSLASKCVVGSGIGMVAKSVNYGTSASDGTCQSGYSGSYSYSCLDNGSVSVVNNCINNNCVVGNNIAGLVSKTVNLNSSGSDGVCASGYQGFYKWNCSSTGIGSVTENNCINSCEVGTASQGVGMISQFVGYGKSGDLGLCDISKGYVGNYSWSCLLNQVTGKVEPKVLTNNCVNYCQVGTLAHGVGMTQKNVVINSSGKDGVCANGYYGNYEWSCDANGKATVTSNKCINSCNVGTLDQGTGMVAKSVSLNSSGTDGVCDANSGYGGSYSWSCSSTGVSKIVANNCVCSSSSDKCLKNCIVGSKSQGIGMTQKIVAVNTSGTDGSCDNANDYWGSFSWSCSSTSIGRVTQNNCKKSSCDLPTGYEGLGDVIASGTSGMLTCSNGYYSSSTPYYSCSCTTEKVKLYLDSGYANLAVELGIGSWNSSSFANNAISSIAIPSGLRVTLYDGDFSGTSQIFTSGASSLGGMDNITSSIKIECLPTFNRTGGNCNPYSCSVASGIGYNGIISASGAGSFNCNSGYKGSVSWYCNSNGTATIQGSCAINSCSIASGTGFLGIASASGSGQIACNTGFEGAINWYCDENGNSVVNGSCTAITCTALASNGYSAQSNLPYTATANSGTIACNQTGYTGNATYTCTNSGPATNISACNCTTGYYKDATGACVAIQCNTSANGFIANTIIPYSATPVAYYCNDPIYNNLQTASFTCSTSASSITPSINNCLKISCTVPTAWNTTIGGSSVFIANNQSLSCNAGYSGSSQYSCVASTAIRPADSVSVPTSPGVITQTGSCTAITCPISGTGFTSRTLNYGSGSFACDASGYSGTITYNCNAQNTPNLSGTCVLASCNISSATHPNLSSYLSVLPTDTLTYVPCATGYYDSIRVKWESVINRLPGEYDWQHATRVYNAMGNVNYTASSSNGGPTASLGSCGLSNPMTYGQADCFCSSPCYWHNQTTKDAGLCNCDSQVFSTHFPTSLSANGLAYKCVNGTLLGSSKCLPITCTAPASNGYSVQSNLPYTATANSGVIACNQTGYTGNATYTCTNSGPATNISACNCTTGYYKDATGACVAITCLIPANFNSTIDGTNVLPTSSAVPLTCKAGFSGSSSYECFSDKIVAYADSNYSGNSVAYGVGTFNYPLAIGNDNISSISIPAGYKATVYQDSVGSSSLSFTSSVNLSGLTFPSGASADNQISEIVITNNGTTNSSGAIRLINSCTQATNIFTPNWYAWTSVGCGSYITYSTNNAVEIMGPEGCGGQWTYYFTYLPSWATKVSFNWRYCTGDWNASYDPGKLYVNNTWYNVFTNGYGYGSCYYGRFDNFGVQGGTAFGPGVYSTDGCCGRAQLYFYDIVVQ